MKNDSCMKLLRVVAMELMSTSIYSTKLSSICSYDEICYGAKEYLTIHKLLATRADLHRTVYMHAKAKAIELMFLDAMVKANGDLHISLHIDNPEQYYKLDDYLENN